ncbi:MAG: transcription antitermination factor NusB [Treponema sp.]|nr:transcription antitermination factor NusB [Treponema sp.]
MSRRKSRILAFQALYSWDVTRASLDDILTFAWLQNDSDSDAELSENAREERTFASLLISGTISNITEIDKVIAGHLSANWSFDRVNKVTIAILRVSTYEILYQKDVSAKIVIDEAVGIAKSYGPDDAYKFVNAILDKIEKNGQ